MKKNHWEVKKLGEVCDVLDSRRKPITKRDRVAGSYPYYGATGILDYVDGYIFDENLILIGEDGAKWGSCERTAFLVDGKCWVNNHAHVIRSNRNVVIDKWIVYYLNLSDLLKYVTGLTVPKLTQERMREIEIPLPPLPEQQRIVKILDQVFFAIDQMKQKVEKNLKNAKELFDTELKKLFLNPPGHWEVKKLGEVCDLVSRGISPKYISSNGLCVLNQKCIRNHKINFELSKRHDSNHKKVSFDRFIQVGDVLVNSTGAGTLGRIAQVKSLKIEAIVDSHITILRPKKNLFFYDFFGYILIFLEEKISKAGEGCGGQIELAKNTLKNDFCISYPTSLPEQQRIVRQLDQLSEQTKKLEAIYQKKLANLEELKKSILQKAFNGELTESTSEIEARMHA